MKHENTKVQKTELTILLNFVKKKLEGYILKQLVACGLNN